VSIYVSFEANANILLKIHFFHSVSSKSWFMVVTKAYWLLKEMQFSFN